MFVKQRFTKIAVWYIIGLICIIVFSTYCIEKRQTNQHMIDELVVFFLFIAIGIMIIIYSMHCIGYYSMTLYINKYGITQTWFGMFKRNIKWSDFKTVQVETIRSFSWVNTRIEAVVCSTIPVKYRIDPDGNNKRVINMEWVLHRSYAVNVICLDDLKPGQFEEFWSYVPERLKT